MYSFLEKYYLNYSVCEDPFLKTEKVNFDFEFFCVNLDFLFVNFEGLYFVIYDFIVLIFRYAIYRFYNWKFIRNKGMFASAFKEFLPSLVCIEGIFPLQIIFLKKVDSYSWRDWRHVPGFNIVYCSTAYCTPLKFLIPLEIHSKLKMMLNIASWYHKSDLKIGQ